MLMEYLTRPRRETRFTLENPLIPLSDPAVMDYLGGNNSAAGVNVTAKSALGLAAYWRGVNLLSRNIAKLPVFCYRRLEDGGKEVDRQHPGFRVLRTPNQEMTYFTFVSTLQAHACTRGNGYAAIVRDSNWIPQELWPLDPECTRPERRPGGTLYYRSRLNDVDLLIPYYSIIHVRGLSGDGLLGYSVIDCLRESLGHSIAIQKYGSAFFGNSARPSIVLTHPGRLNEQAAKRLRESWLAVHGGPDNSGRPAVLEEGMKVEPFSISNDDAQYLQSRQEATREIANILGIPPHKLGDATRTSYSSLEQENQSLLDDAFDPWLCSWEQELNSKLLLEDQKTNDTHYFSFRRQALVRADITSRYSVYNVALQNGILNRDEVRALEDLNPIPDGSGQQYYVPLNMQPAGEEPEDDTEAEDDTEDEMPAEDMPMQSGRSSVLVVDVVKLQLEGLREDTACFVRRVAEQARRKADKPSSFVRWLDDFLVEDNREAFESRISTKVRTLAIVTEGSTGHYVTRAADIFFGLVRTQINTVAERTTATDLPVQIEALATTLEAETPVRFTALISEVFRYET